MKSTLVSSKTGERILGDCNKWCRNYIPDYKSVYMNDCKKRKFCLIACRMIIKCINSGLRRNCG